MADGKETFVAELCDRLLDGQPHALALYGHGASGKSSFALQLQQALGAERVNLLETDPYVVSGEVRAFAVPKAFPGQKLTACLPLAHELSALERDIRALQSGLDILTIATPWSPSRRLEAAKPILLVEGMSAAFLPKGLFDCSVCFYTDGKTELTRRLARDTAQRGRQAEWIEKTHIARRQQYQYYYQPYQEQADYLIDQSDNRFILQRSSKFF